MRDHFEVYYKGNPVPLPSGEDGRGNLIWDDDPIPIWQMNESEQSYWHRLMDVPSYNDEEYLKMDQEADENRQRRQSMNDSGDEDELLDLFRLLK
tara:strand:+ start:647 stop:931 length:285 start_codon:yes stop_codon:yes gene_type:complete